MSDNETTTPSIHNAPHVVDGLLPAGTVSHRGGKIGSLDNESGLSKRTCIKISHVTETSNVFRKMIQRVQFQRVQSVLEMFFKRGDHAFLE